MRASGSRVRLRMWTRLLVVELWCSAVGLSQLKSCQKFKNDCESSESVPTVSKVKKRKVFKLPLGILSFLISLCCSLEIFFFG